MYLKNIYNNHMQSKHTLLRWNRQYDRYLAHKSSTILQKRPDLRFGIAGSLIIIKTCTRTLSQLGTPFEKLALGCHEVFQATIKDRPHFLTHTRKAGIYLLGAAGSVVLIPAAPFLGMKDGYQIYQASRGRILNKHPDSTGNPSGGITTLPKPPGDDDNDTPPPGDDDHGSAPVKSLSYLLPAEVLQYMFTFFENSEKAGPHRTSKHFHTQCVRSTILHEHVKVNSFLNFLKNELHKSEKYPEVIAAFESLINLNDVKFCTNLNTLQAKLLEIRRGVVKQLCPLEDETLKDLKKLCPPRGRPEFFIKIFELVNFTKRYKALQARNAALTQVTFPMVQEALKLGFLELAVQITHETLQVLENHEEKILKEIDTNVAIRFANMFSDVVTRNRMRSAIIKKMVANEQIEQAIKLSNEVEFENDSSFILFEVKEAYKTIIKFLIKSNRRSEAEKLIPKNSKLSQQIEIATIICLEICQTMNKVAEIEKFLKDPLCKLVNKLVIQSNFILRMTTDNKKYQLAFEMYKRIDKNDLIKANQELLWIISCALSQKDPEFAYSIVDDFVEGGLIWGSFGPTPYPKDQVIIDIVRGFVKAGKINRAKEIANKIQEPSLKALANDEFLSPSEFVD